MRISDWSSDVGSSDLWIGGGGGDRRHRRVNAAFHLVPPAPAPGAGVFARQHLGRAGFAADGEIALRLQRVARQLLRLERSDERRVGKGCVSTCSSRWSPYH